MSPRRLSILLLLSSCAIALSAFKSAKMELPASLAGSAEALAVTGHNPRTWNRPIGFGPYATSSVREGVEFSWSVEAFGIRGGMAKQRYRLVLEGPEASAWEVECLTRQIEAWRDGWSVELTRAFTPRLVCGLRERSEQRVYRLVLGSSGSRLHGVVHAVGAAESGPPLLSVRSVHRLEGSRLPLDEPAGYALERAGTAVAAVETINRGRVWIGPELELESRGPAAATAAALLLFKVELSPQDP